MNYSLNFKIILFLNAAFSTFFDVAAAFKKNLISLIKFIEILNVSFLIGV